MKSIVWGACNYLFDYPRYLYGLYRLHRLKKPIVSIFGGKGADKNDKYYKSAFDFTNSLVKHDISVLTGGGPGIMEAALCGGIAQKKRNRMLGIGVTGIDSDFASACKHETIYMRNLALRKSLLIDYSVGFICFPGGIGTLDEILEVMNLLKLNLHAKVPIILIDRNYWKFFLSWLDQAVDQKFIKPEYIDLITITDDLKHAESIVLNSLMKN